jgi:hypothetical protein
VDPYRWLAALGDDKIVAGVIAVVGLVGMVAAVTGRFRPPDEFSRVDWRKRRWTSGQSDRYFDEKEEFERWTSKTYPGLSQALLAITLLAGLLVIVVGGAAMMLVGKIFGMPTSLFATACAILTVILGRRLGYACRRIERFNAFRDGDDDWMYSPHLRAKRQIKQP